MRTSALPWRYMQDEEDDDVAFAGLGHSASIYFRFVTEHHRCVRRSLSISQPDFNFNFNRFSDSECVNHFRFDKENVLRIATDVSWPQDWKKTRRNRYSTNTILSTCIVLKRYSMPSRWVDLEDMFGKHASQLSEIFWECAVCAFMQ